MRSVNRDYYDNPSEHFDQILHYFDFIAFISILVTILEFRKL